MNARTLTDVDRIIHAPARLMVMTILNGADADFVYLLRETGLSKGNLATHLTKLEASGYIGVYKEGRGTLSRTTYKMTKTGRAAFARYREGLQRIVDHTAPGGEPQPG